ncbi:hypothetical protein KEJ47_10525, partial [Candidatus Bathyarchaeota archaeon]|nr:hypothetical protein [Candidatus Bathyarchaeota archaeon]
PEVREAIKSGELSIRKARELIKAPKESQPELIEKAKAGELPLEEQVHPPLLVEPEELTVEKPTPKEVSKPPKMPSGVKAYYCSVCGSRLLIDWANATVSGATES